MTEREKEKLLNRMSEDTEHIESVLDKIEYLLKTLITHLDEKKNPAEDGDEMFALIGLDYTQQINRDIQRIHHSLLAIIHSACK